MPSDLESSWFKAIEAKEEGCAWIMSSIPLMAEWLSTIQVRHSKLPIIYVGHSSKRCLSVALRAKACHVLCAQKRDNLLYSMASSFLPKVPKRKEGALHGLNGKVFSKFVLSNTCPGACRGLSVLGGPSVNAAMHAPAPHATEQAPSNCASMWARHA